MGSRAKPFVKWAGGKKTIAKKLAQMVPIDFCEYHEPFLGGGALFFELYNQGILEGKRVFLSDQNSELVNAFQVVQKGIDPLIDTLKDFSKMHNEAFYYEIRSWDRSADFFSIDPVMRAVRFIYLNKTCYNGLYRVNSKGFFNVPMGKHSNPNICDEKTLHCAHEALQGVVIECCDFTKALEKVGSNSFVYLDPPYLSQGHNAGFASYTKQLFLYESHQKLAHICQTLDSKNVYWMQSNIAHPKIISLYEKYGITMIEKSHIINANAKKREKIQEIVITNYKEKAWI
ncbi:MULTISPECIES: Dam family site-specific DNA-(adenine-N6)-methyltransferase [unclassified Nitratiruptor]|uniref:DNA adenine methylase n=1 Tax=unclassified Nitratiruptor TaxID=2624044 RepID=UPI001916870D|nr:MULTISPECIES: Dam family site-specific DNA-(adenine-N6)-methyltransferase [unclassified Nitratiruptor]BCD60576.1 DNA adenine methylase [Nitratiruptor sp. YY08-10]BCD64507.1 DNA adenine methylase [Nitratiruptor sp. YY08-14]